MELETLVCEKRALTKQTKPRQVGEEEKVDYTSNPHSTRQIVTLKVV